MTAFRSLVPGLPALACLAATVFAVDPLGLGGVLVRAGAGPLRDAWLEFLQARRPESAPWRRLPATITDERLLGGLDLTATLASGAPVLQRGVLSEVDGGTLVVPMAERLDLEKAASIGSALDTGRILLERDGFTETLATRFSVVLLDESDREEPPPPPSITDRVAITLDLEFAASQGEAAEDLFLDVDRSFIEEAAQRLPDVEVEPEMSNAICATSIALGVRSSRSLLFAQRVARVGAALDGRLTVSKDDIALASQLVLAPRATQLPHAEPDPDDSPQDPERSPDQQAQEEKQDSAAQRDKQEALENVMIEAARAMLPKNLLASLASESARAAQSTVSARMGARPTLAKRGRPVGVKRGDPKRGNRLSILDTLRAAAPWQVVRRRAGTHKTGHALEIQPSDYRVRRYKQRAESVTIFVVDASGSAALHRLAEAKGAVELLLAECYVRRDRVALITFSGRGVDVALPPTRSLVRAKRRLAGLPGGGGTPMASAIDQACIMARSVQRLGQRPVVVFLTDGKANLTRDGEADRQWARDEALAAARAFAHIQASSLFIDVSPRPQPAAQELAAAMLAQYIGLPHASAARLSASILLAA